MVFDLPESGRTEVSIWTLQGQKLGSKNLGIQSKGRHELPIQDIMNIKSIASGQFLLTLEVNGKKRRIAFLK
ncbi:MAG: hypothetical protein ACK44U_02905 [Sphingobacteriales bacterium]